jgi:phospholipid/cholesterol/gamma-HCH transport system ATP-binding protein
MSSQTTLQIRQLKKSFGGKEIHRGVDLDLLKGECLALFGGSGTGKSLILRSIIGLEHPDAGSIRFHGRELGGIRERDWIEIRKQIAYVFQNGALFDSLSVYENIAYPLRAHTRLGEDEIEACVARMLQLVDLPGAESLLPGELSGGMQKRVGLARAMVLDPEVLLLDEPTAGLDPANTERFIGNILKLKKMGMTAILVTHDIPTALALADRIAVLHDGRIHCIETTQGFQESRDPIIRSFLLQSKGHSHKGNSNEE